MRQMTTPTRRVTVYGNRGCKRSASSETRKQLLCVVIVVVESSTFKAMSVTKENIMKRTRDAPHLGSFASKREAPTQILFMLLSVQNGNDNEFMSRSASAMHMLTDQQCLWYAFDRA